jgi:hypothetical protein
MRIADNNRNNHADVDSNRIMRIPKSNSRITDADITNNHICIHIFTANYAFLHSPIIWADLNKWKPIWEGG